MKMDSEVRKAVIRVAARHIRRNTPIERAWGEVVKVARRGVGPKVAKAALDLPVTGSLTRIGSEYAALLGRDRPKAKVKGLWFGLVELVQDDTTEKTVWTPYIAGARAFKPGDQNWPVRPLWMPKDCYAPNEAMRRLSELRRRHKNEHWLIETALIEPLNMLIAACFVTNTPSSMLLGSASSRGIGCGFDDGDHWTLGVVDKSGFKPKLGY
jgi:hypothetical protein